MKAPRVQASPLSVSVAALGFLAWFPLWSMLLSIEVGRELPAWSAVLFVPGVLLFAAMPFAATLGTLLGCYNLLRGTGGGSNLLIGSLGLGMSASSVAYGAWLMNHASWL